MSAEGDVLKEFLVSLGFKVDSASLKKYLDSVAGATSSTKALGGAAVGAIVSTTLAVAKISEVMETLYYTSQRAGSSVGNIQSFGYAISQSGGSAEAARQSIENLGHFIRSMPGSAQFLERLGVSPAHTHDAVLALVDLKKTLSAMPQYQGLAYANMLGMDERTFLALTQGTLVEDMDDYNRRLKEAGVDSDKAAAEGHKFMMALRGISAEADVLGTKLEKAFAPFLTQRLLEMDEFLTDMINKPKEVEKTFYQGLTPQPVQDAVTDAQGGGLTSFKKGHLLPDWFYVSKPGYQGVTAEAKQNATRQSLLQYYQSQGWTPAQAAGIVAGLQLENGTFDPHALGDNNHAIGIGQWHKDRAARFKQWSGHDIYSSTLDEQKEFVQYELTHQEKAAGDALRRTSDPYAAGYQFRTLYERPANLIDSGAATGQLAQKIAGGGTTINATTTINVNGAQSPAVTADAVAQKQTDIVANLNRMASGGVQ